MQLDSSTSAQTASDGQWLLFKAYPRVTDQEEKKLCVYSLLVAGENLITHKRIDTKVWFGMAGWKAGPLLAKYLSRY